uniref:Uncharacterized protein n=1 Tax=Sinocyclocheilus anshuiensis TaxID=1608454 RepID=A0A671MRF9_9TELE
MAEETILKVLCGNHGSMEYERLLDISYGLKEISAENSLDKIIRRSDIFTVVQRSESKEVFAQTTVELCRRSECEELCGNLHLCKYDIFLAINFQIYFKYINVNIFSTGILFWQLLCILKYQNIF